MKFIFYINYNFQDRMMKISARKIFMILRMLNILIFFAILGKTFGLIERNRFWGASKINYFLKYVRKRLVSKKKKKTDDFWRIFLNI